MPRLLLALALALTALVASHAEPEAPSVAIPPAVLQKNRRLDRTDQKEATILSERVQLALEADAVAPHRFVERTALDDILREQALSLSGFTGSASSVRVGRLVHADWVLRLRLRADDLRRPRVEAEVVDALRADMLGRAESPLARLPDESWLQQPSDEVVEIVRTVAARALDLARDRSASYSGRTILAPLVFLNRDQSDRLAPLGGLLRSSLQQEHPQVRVLDYEQPDGAMDESVLFQAGMTDLEPGDWALVADVYLWGEFFEEAGTVKLKLWLWRDGDEARLLTFQGPATELEALARQAAETAAGAAVGGRVDLTADTRARAARRLLDASVDFAPKPGQPWDRSPRNLARQQTRLRYFAMASFFSPENPMIREQVYSLGRSLATDEVSRDFYQRQFWRTFDQFLIGPDGRPHLALLARAAHYEAAFPGYAARFERIGRILAAHPLDDESMREVCARFSSAAISRPDEPGLAAAQEAMQPILLRFGRRQNGSSGRPPESTPTPSGPTFTAWEKTPASELLDAARAGPLVNAPALDAPQVRFSPWQLVPRTQEKRPPARLLSTLVDDASLWFTFYTPPENREARAYTGARLHLGSQEIEWLPERLSVEAPISSYWRENARVWVGTRGNGLRIIDHTSGAVKTIDQTSGLPTADIVGLHRGRDGLYLAPGASVYTSDTVITRLDLATGALAQVAVPHGADLAAFPSALRAAIASFDEDAPPRVRLPPAPAFGFDDSSHVPGDGGLVPRTIPPPHRLAPEAAGRFSPANDPALARHACVTGPRDGYWIASHHSLVWAAGSRRIPLAHWITGCIRGLADDGRHLFVQVLRRPLPEGGDAGHAGSPSSLRIYVYDHAEGRWLGWMSASHFGSMHATPGLLALTSSDAIPQPLLLINTSALGGASSRPIATAASRTGWTPLLSALWADDAAAVDRLLAAGARWDLSDVRGWHPLQLAAAWSSPDCLEAVLRHGIPGNQARPATDPALSPTYPARRDDRASALHAAVLRGREEIVERLLAAGASPLAFDPAGSPLQLAVRHASPEIVVRLLAAVPEEKYREPLRLDAERHGRKDLLGLLGPSALAAKPAWRPADSHHRLRDALNSTPPDLAGIRDALSHGADPARFDGSKAAFLYSAVLDRKFAAFDLLLSATTPAALNKVERGGCLGADVLRGLLAAKRPDLARKLFSAGYKPAPPPDDHSRVHKPILWYAITCGDADLVRDLRAANFRLAAPDSRPPRQAPGERGRGAPSTPPPLAADMQPVPEAVRQRNTELLRALLEPVPFENAGFDVDVFSPEGLTPLFEATDAGWVDGVRLLLSAGASSLAGDHHTGRSLHEAASRRPEVAVLFNGRTDRIDNQLTGAEAVAAVFRGDPAELSSLPLGPAVLRYRDFRGWTALHHAARQSRYEFVGRLLAAGAPVDALTGAGESALCLAALGGDATCVDLLITMRAQPNLRHRTGWLPLHVAARSGRADLVKRLLAAGADPNLPAGPDGDTAALAAASAREEVETLQLLAAARAGLTAVNQAGQGALEAAVLSNSPEKIQFLLDHGVRWQKPRSPDLHPMNVASKNGLTGSIRKLQQLGLRSPLAISLAKDDATRSLLQSDTSPEGRRLRADEEEWPAILSDPERWRERIVAHLKAGGNPNHRSARWTSPLLLALEQHNAELVRFLVSQGADPSLLVVPPQTGYYVEKPENGTAFYGWFMGRWRIDTRTVPSDLDEFAAAIVPLFWPHERNPHISRQMLDIADRSGLARTTAWMRAHAPAAPAPSDK